MIGGRKLPKKPKLNKCPWCKERPIEICTMASFDNDYDGEVLCITGDCPVKPGTKRFRAKSKGWAILKARRAWNRRSR